MYLSAGTCIDKVFKFGRLDSLFQELLELAQRKFHRQVSLYADSMNMAAGAMNVGAYPRLFLPDFLTEEEKKKLKEEQKMEEEKTLQAKADEARKAEEEACKAAQKAQGEGAGSGIKEDESKAEDAEDGKKEDPELPRPASGSSMRQGSGLRPLSSRGRPALKSRKTSSMQGMAAVAEALKDVEGEEGGKASKASAEHCIRVLCEQEGNWHAVEGAYIPILDSLEITYYQDIVRQLAPYTARLLAVLKHTSLTLPILTTEKGASLQKMLEDVSVMVESHSKSSRRS